MISTEIQRLQSAKAALKTAIENKGVTVPESTTLDGYAALVDAIQTIPAAYTELEYIESSGTQFIDTGIAVNTLVNPRIVTKFQMLNSGDLDWFGTDNTNAKTIVWNVKNSAAVATYIRWGSTVPRNFSGSASSLCFNDSMHTLDVGGVEITVQIPIIVDGTSVGTLASDSGASMNSTSNILIFKARQYIGKVRVASFSIYSNGAAVRNLIPAKRNSDNAIGMYDKMSGAFFTNAGTGTFSYGELA